MNLETKRISLEALQEETNRLQGSAAAPLASAWVKANAGTGKTHVLTLRVLRLLLAGTKPERILCLTYTKAAAALMSRRVFEQLAGWVTATDTELKKALRIITGTDDKARQKILTDIQTKIANDRIYATLWTSSTHFAVSKRVKEWDPAPGIGYISRLEVAKV